MTFSNEVKDLDAKTIQALAFVADFIYKYRYDVDWIFVSSLLGFSIDWTKHPRLIRSQSFRDDDYLRRILDFLIDCYKQDSSGTKVAISYIIGSGVIDDASSPRYRGALITLGVFNETESEGDLGPIFPVQNIPYLDLGTYPDDFYKELVKQINLTYSFGLYLPSQILIRKLFENCLIDILRKRYGFKEIDVFYDAKERRFHDFSRLLDSTRDKLGDFNVVSDCFNKVLLERIEKYREMGNSRAHNINVIVTKKEMDECKDEVSFLTKSLIRAIKIL